MSVTIGSLLPFGVASGEVNVIHRHKLAIPKIFPNREKTKKAATTDGLYNIKMYKEKPTSDSPAYCCRHDREVGRWKVLCALPCSKV